jgi:enoyl-CoA hydratase/carnithine racemase
VAVRSEEILHLTLNRPHVHNAFSAGMRDALAEGLTVAVADPGIERIVLDGAGPSFCSGGDLDEFGSFPDPATAHAVRSTRNPARLLSECASRVHTIVHGACIGAGAELPAFTARVVADPGSFFALPELGMGLVPGAGGTVSLPRRIGRQRTAWLALGGERIDAQTALAWGLVDELAER